jgi:LSD1 subclass zinc finger protein
MTKVHTCPKCGHDLGAFDQTCQNCGTPYSYDPGEAAVGCSVCGADIGAYTETCPACGETGYPALRPRKGKGFKGSPDYESDRPKP